MFYFEEKNGLNLYKSSLLDKAGLLACFTTRTGGFAPEPHKSFSLGTAKNPELSHYIEQNRTKLCETLDISQNSLVVPVQKHTDNIKVITSSTEDVSNCDALITNVKGVSLMLLYADCTPIILFSPEKNIVAVVHAGWRGTVQKIAPKTVQIMQDKFKVKTENILVAIGANIGKCCYPVAQEVAEQLENSLATKEFAIKSCYANIFTTNEYDNNLINVDLKRINVQQLINCGVENIDVSDQCTCCSNDIFFSYRAEKGNTGRHAAIASLL